MQIRPLFDRILIKRLEAETKSRGGLFLPESASEKPHRGEVIAVGNGRVSKNGDITPLQVKIGDRVVFGKYAGTEIKVDGEERLVLREDEVFGIISA